MLSDIQDGSGFRKKEQFYGRLTTPEHLGLIMFTDGVPLWRSSRQSLWPIYLAVVNFPPHMRMRKENLLLSAIWVGEGKPNMKQLLQPTLAILKELEVDGVVVNTASGAKTIRARLLCGLFDLVAKAPALNMKQFNSYNGCSTCLHPGVHHGRTMLYPPHVQYPLRTHASVLTDAQRAESSNTVVNGIFGTSVLSASLDVVDDVPVDYMHCVLEGVVKWLLNNWVKSENHRQPFYLGRNLKEIDALLLQQRPPHSFMRPPRSLSKHLHYWKASEFRTWLLYYSLPLLTDFLPPLYVHHFSLLVTAMHILLKQEISKHQISVADAMIDAFCKLLPELYGEDSSTANAHCLTHLTKYVRLWGPLWTHSAFRFESMNGHLTRTFHSQTQIHDQLIFSVQVSQALQHLSTYLINNEDEKTLEFLSFCRNSLPRKNMFQIAPHVYIIGRLHYTNLTNEEHTAISMQSLGSVGSRIETFSRLFCNGILYHSVTYKREGGKRNSSICCYHDGISLKFGEIQKFCRTTKTFAVLKSMAVSSSSLTR